MSADATTTMAQAIPFKPGVLDQAPMGRGEDSPTALENCLRLARACDALG